MKNVKFAFTQTVQHLHPHLETEIEYAGVAQINGEEVWIKCLTATQNLLIHGSDASTRTEPQCAELAIPITAEDQAWANGTMGQLLGKCRYHALNETYKMEAAEGEAKLAAFSKKHNRGFIPNPHDTKYMNAE